MQFSAATCYLASLVATLVVVTTSLPQSPFGPQQPERQHHRIDPFNFQPPKGCLGVGAIRYRKDIEPKRLRRDSHLPETHAGALDPRKPIDLPCGIIFRGGQSDTFGIATTRPRNMFWKFGGAILTGQTVFIVQVVLNGRDKVIDLSPASRYRIIDFRLVDGALYYLALSGQSMINMRWFFEFPYA